MLHVREVSVSRTVYKFCEHGFGFGSLSTFRFMRYVLETAVEVSGVGRLNFFQTIALGN